MKYARNNVIAMYAENEDGRIDELIADIRDREYKFTYNTKEELLLKAKNNKVKEFSVPHNFLLEFYQVLENHYCGSCNPDGSNVADVKQYEAEERKKPLILKEKIRRAIRWELDEKELDRIISFDYRYEKDDYYDFDLIIDKIHALMNGEKSVSYFKSWCILLMRCFMDNMNCRSKKLLSLYYDLGYYFDGVAFMDSSLDGEEKLKECRGIIAVLKNYNHAICDLKNKKATDFTTNGVITYVALAFTLNDGEQSLYQVCVVDEKRKAINYLLVPEFDYSEDINYTFLSQADYEDLSAEYWDDYALDTSMTIDYALKAGRR